MLWSKKKKTLEKSEQNIHRMKMQIEMVESLRKNGYGWDEIEKAIGFSEINIRFMQSIIEKTKTNKQ